MSEAKTEQIIREYLPQIVHMSMATVSGTKPWVCEVHFSYDDDLNLYFISSATTRHAQEIIASQYVAGNIVTQHHKNQKVRCIDFEGTAEMLDGATAAQTAYKSFAARFGESENLLNEIRQDGDTHFFKISVENYYVFDSYDGPRSKSKLVWNGGQK